MVSERTMIIDMHSAAMLYYKEDWGDNTRLATLILKESDIAQYVDKNSIRSHGHKDWILHFNTSIMSI